MENLLNSQEKNDFFAIKTTNMWIDESKKLPTPKKLFGDFWCEGEVCILFSSANTGKSILAVQVADSISKGTSILNFSSDTEPQKVLYFDFEMTKKQFENRYSEDFNNHYSFSDNFLRAEINPDTEIPENVVFEDFLVERLEHAVVESNVKTLIIDNITYLKDETENARKALPLMKHLKRIKVKHNLSLLVLAHCPKRNFQNPLTKNDLQGSSMLMTFCDSAFAVGESAFDKSLRYLKQIKVRNGEFLYDSENVLVCEVHKPHNFLRFDFVNFASEKDHLKERPEKEKSELEKEIEVFLETQPGISSYAIAQKLCPSDVKFESFRVKVNNTVNRIKNRNNP